jgi:hypothetical protein
MGEMSFGEMVEFLAELYQDREPSGVGLAMRRSQVERELMIQLGASPPTAERRQCVRVPGHLPVKLHVGGEEVGGTIYDLGEGGVRLRAVMSPPIGATVDLEMLPHPATRDLHPARAEAMVTWLRPVENHGFELGLRFTDDTESNRRRMRRVVIELLRALPVDADETASNVIGFKRP